jgi:hypothetical protein
MQVLTFVDGEITWRDKVFIYQGFEKIDSMMVHILMSDGCYAFVGEDTEINGVVQRNADNIIATLTA